MRKTLEEQTNKSHTHSLRVTSRSFGGRESGYISPIRRQEMIIEAVRVQKTNPPEERLDRVLVERYGEEGAEHMMYIQEIALKQQQREEQMATMLRESGGKLPSSPGRRTTRASKDDLNSVVLLPALAEATAAQGMAEDKEGDERRAGATFFSGGLPLPPWRKV